MNLLPNDSIASGQVQPRRTDSHPGSRIICRDLTVTFPGNVIACDSVNLDAAPGEILSLVGPSGCGKTTLLRAMAGLQTPTSGSVTLEPISDRLRGAIGFVFQQPALLRWRTAAENIMLAIGLTDRSLSRNQRRQLAVDMLDQVKLSDAADRFPHQLSGGMQMRVSIARALVTQPTVLLMDEPFAALDDMLRNQLGQLILELWDQRRFTAVMVTHNIAEAIMLSHRIEIMRNGNMETGYGNVLSWPRHEEQRRSSSFGKMYGQVSDALNQGRHD